MLRKFTPADRLFTICVCMVHLVFFLAALHYKHIYNGDSAEYIYAAVNIKDLGFFYSGNPAMPVEPELMTFRTPLYPLLLAAVYSFSVNNWIVLVLQNILSVCNILLLRKMLLRLGYNTAYDRVLLLLLLLYPAQFIHAHIVEPEILLQSLILLYIYCFLLFYEKKQGRYLWLMTLALVSGMFVKPVLYPYTAVHVLILLFIFFRRGAAFSHPWRLVPVALLPVCVILCYQAWNHSRTGKFHFTSNQSFNALYYFYTYKRSTEGVPAARQFLREEREKTASLPAFRDRYDYANNRGKELLQQNFPAYLAHHLKYSLRFFLDPGKGDIDLFTGRLTYSELYTAQNRDYMSSVRAYGWAAGSIRFFRGNPLTVFIGLIFLCNLLKAAGLVLFARSRQIPAALRWFVLFFLAYFALLTGPISTPRYVLPVSLVYTGAAVLGWIYARRQRKTIPVVPPVH